MGWLRMRQNAEQCLANDRVASKGRVRVLQVIENLNNRAVESWLLRVFRQSVTEYPWIDWTFFSVLPELGEFDDQVRSAEGDVIHSLYEVGDKRRFLSSMREVMKRGHYDILHCHHDIMSAAYLVASAGLPFRKRIVHVHNTALSLPTPNEVKASLVREPMRQVCLRMADQIVGISQDALRSLLGDRRPDPHRHRVVHYAVDTARFTQAQLETTTVRESLGLDPSARIMLFVGRMVDYKNPFMVIEVLRHLLKSDDNFCAVFAGTGHLENEVRELARKNALEKRVRVLGFRDDVARLMAAADVLLWPSLEEPKEGLGLGIVEAQAAGLPIVMSRSVPDEAIVIQELSAVAPLADGPVAWAQSVLEVLNRPRPSRAECLARVEASSFSMQAGVSNIVALYN